MTYDRIDQLAVNTIRTLSIDAIQAANSGHPGLPMGAAPMAYVLWSRFLKVNPKDSSWVDRDRFVLSAGHGSALLYSLLHLAGYDVTLDDLKNFRQLGSRTPGHPEVHDTDGVEATTGPLGQGIANAVGMAMAEAHLAATYNQDDHHLVDHYTYALCGDGDLMEGISYEAASLAGKLKLNKLVVLYDSNDISLDGDLDKSFIEDIQGRFEAMAWNYLRVDDGNDMEAIHKALDQARTSDKPTLIEVKTVIGFGSPKAGTNKVHGSPLGEEGIAVAKEAYGWDYDAFHVPQEVRGRFQEILADRGESAQTDWQTTYEAYQAAYPDLAAQFKAAHQEKVAVDLEDILPKYTVGDEAKASRATSQAAIQALGKALPYFWGGSADLSSSNNTMNKADSDFDANNYAGRNIWFGVREFAMGAILNGIMLHGGSRAYVGTFFVFSDYLKASIRLAAISKLPGTYVFTHDSVAVGEDGPTHEPVEQLATFRAMPNLNVIRPADGNEVSAAWKIALESIDRPTLLVLSRQGLPVLESTHDLAYRGVDKGAYVISPAKGDQPQGILLASGSEVDLAIKAQAELAAQGQDVSVVSVPSMNRFDEQDQAYKESVLPKAVRNRMAIEMGSSFGWERYVGLDGYTLGIDRYGASGKGAQVVQDYGFTVDNLVSLYQEHFS